MVSRQDTATGYDIIGDVHGCAHTLEKLLLKMGYEQYEGVFKHPQRIAVFLGDIVDRGPRIRESLHLVKAMTDAGAAHCIMGNHEYNALGYTTLAPSDFGREHLREHTARHNRLIAETLEQFASYPEEWRMFLQWFRTLPLFLDFGSFRVVHACWDQALISRFQELYPDGQLSDELLIESSKHGTFAYDLFDRLLRGTSLPLPEGGAIKGRDGYTRNEFRTKFWSVKPQTFRDVVFQPDPLPDDVQSTPLTSRELEKLRFYQPSLPPVFVGHYWLQGKPKPLCENVACLDYSAVKFGRLVAYRFDGEQRLSKDKFTWVYVDPEA